MRTPVYSAHPINQRPITDDDRFHNHIDMGERDFSYRLTPEFHNLDVEAEIFNQPPFVLSFFPSGNGEKKETESKITNSKILLSSYKKITENEYLLRLFNTSESKEETLISMNGKEFEITFTPFEAKGFKSDGKSLTECNLIGE